jgi:threonine dehydratase
VELPTPVEEASAALSDGRPLFLKREDVHELGAFKWRGALPTLEKYRAGGASAVVTASTGNHGAATAWAAERTGVRAVVFVPADASETKLALLEDLGAELRTVGADLDESKDLAREHAAANDLPFFEDGAEPAQFEGYEAIGEEILRQLGRAPATVIVPIGNGALIIGVHLGIGRVTGVVAKEAPVMALSVHAGHPVECDRCATFADGMAVRVAIPSAV